MSPNGNHNKKKKIDAQKPKMNTNILLKKVIKVQEKEQKQEMKRTTKTTGKHVIRW